MTKRHIGHRGGCFLAIVLVSIAHASSNAPVFIVLPSSSDVVVRKAADELRAYLPRVYGIKATAVSESQFSGDSPAVYLGDTRYAAANKVDFRGLRDEEWLVKSVGGSLVIGGGGRRGTLYGVYHFLEDELGVHWFSPSVEEVPRRRFDGFCGIDRRGRPAMRYRDIYFVSGPGTTAFLARNRMNTESSEYGGRMRYSRVATNHSLYRYLGTPEEVRRLFADHPDWFPLIDGERQLDRRANSASKTQLCLTNPELRRYFVGRLRTIISADRAAASKAKVEPPMFYAIDQNDCYDGFCRCLECAAVIEREGGTSGLLLDFANHVAAALEDDAPDATFQMMAYFSTERLPRSVRPRRNVGIRLCDPASDVQRPWSDAANGWMRGNLESWGRICSRIAVWDYQITFGSSLCTCYPTPNERTFAQDLRMLAANCGDGVFFEHEEPIGADMRDMKVWLEMKLVEDPSQDADMLVKQFTDGFYGPAGTFIRRYRDLIARAADARGAAVCWFPSICDYDFIDDGVMNEACAIFDEASRAVAGDAEISARVDHARLSLDKLRIVRGDTSAIGRYRATWDREKARRFTRTNEKSSGYRKNVEHFLRCAALYRNPPVPSRFADVPRGDLHVLHAARGKFDGRIMQCIADDSSAVGEAARFVFRAFKDRMPESAPAFAWPFRCAITAAPGALPEVFETSDELDGCPRGYHWYRLAKGATLTSRSELSVFAGYSMPIGSAVADGKEKDGPFDVYASVRILGPDVIRCGAASRDSIYLLDQVAVVRSGGGGGRKY